MTTSIHKDTFYLLKWGEVNWFDYIEVSEEQKKRMMKDESQVLIYTAKGIMKRNILAEERREQLPSYTHDWEIKMPAFLSYFLKTSTSTIKAIYKSNNPQNNRRPNTKIISATNQTADLHSQIKQLPKAQNGYMGRWEQQSTSNNHHANLLAYQILRSNIGPWDTSSIRKRGCIALFLMSSVILWNARAVESRWIHERGYLVMNNFIWTGM